VGLLKPVRDLQRSLLAELRQHLRLHAPGSLELFEHDACPLRIVLAQ